MAGARRGGLQGVQQEPRHGGGLQDARRGELQEARRGGATGRAAGTARQARSRQGGGQGQILSYMNKRVVPRRSI